MFDYSKLREVIKDSGYTEYDFINIGHISNTVLQNIRTNKNITIKSLEKVLTFLNIEDASIIKFVRDKKDYDGD